MKLTWEQPRVPVDLAAQHAAEVATGLRCGDCMDLRVGAGCSCDREHLFQQALLASALFADRQLVSLGVDPKRAGKAAFSTVMGAAVRASRKYGQPLPDGFAGRMRKRYGVEPRFTPPRTYEASHLPV